MSAIFYLLFFSSTLQPVLPPLNHLSPFSVILSFAMLENSVGGTMRCLKF